MILRCSVKISFGGEVAVLKDKTTKNNILTIVSEHENCGNSFFSGYFKKEGQFINIIDGKVMNKLGLSCAKLKLSCKFKGKM